MNKKILFLVALLLGVNACVHTKQPQTQAPPKPKHAGFVMKTKRGGNITTKKSGQIVKVRSKNFLR